MFYLWIILIFNFLQVFLLVRIFKVLNEIEIEIHFQKKEVQVYINNLKNTLHYSKYEDDLK